MSARLRRSGAARAVLLATAVVLGVAACGPPSRSAPVRITVPPGATFAQVAESLAARRVVSNALFFKLRARLSGADRRVVAGVYEFAPGVPADSVLHMLSRGQVVAERFTVPEGYSIFETAALAQEKLEIPADSFLAAARDSALLDSLGIDAPSLEGYLWPDTYQVEPDVTARELVRRMAREFFASWRPEWQGRLDSLGLTRHQVLTMASIVEGEARVDSERETIAGVYYNRLRRGMPLQADPTVQYAISLDSGRRKPRLYEKDYQLPSPYNTYQHPGLPPGPVDSPGRRSIEAALSPARVPYYFFVAGPDGHHTFTRTYDQHLRAVAQARRARADSEARSGTRSGR